MKIIRKKLTPDELQVPNTRYDAGCDCVQQTYDGGATWVDAPLQDPRTSLIYLRPALTGDAACDAATGIISNFQNGLAQGLSSVSAGANAVGAGNFIASVLLDLTGIGLLFSLIVDFAAIIISIGTSGVEAAFTSTVYDQLICILIENMDTDGQISAAQFTAIQSDIDSTFGSLSDVNLVMQGWLAPLGNVGLSNLGVIFAESGDCAACDCDLALGGNGLNGFTVGYINSNPCGGGSYDSGTDSVIGDHCTGAFTHYIQASLYKTIAFTVGSVRFDFSVSAPGVGIHAEVYVLDDTGTTLASYLLIPEGDGQTYTLSGLSIAPQELQFVVAINGSSPTIGYCNLLLLEVCP